MWTAMAGLWELCSLGALAIMFRTMERREFTWLLARCLAYAAFTAIAFVPVLMITGTVPMH